MMKYTPENKHFGKWRRILNILAGLAYVAVLASCVKNVDDIPSSFDSNQKMAMTFFFYALVCFPCIIFIHAFLMFKIEKLFLNQAERDKMNKITQESAEREIKKTFGSFFDVIKKMFKSERK